MKPCSESRSRARWAPAFGLALTVALAHAQPSPVGAWKTIDDETKKERSLIRISESGGVLSGRLEKLLDPAIPPDAVCVQCSDERKGKPVLGMTLLRDMRPSEGDKGAWEGGDILDPSNGKVYKVRLKPIDRGARLDVHGYIGTPLLGRTQTWIRAE